MAFVQGEPWGEASGLAEVDLTETVTNLSRVRAKNRARLANSDLTRAFLNAALRLTDQAFTSGDEELVEGTRQTLSYLSRPRVVSRAQHDYPDLVPTEAKFRDRWAGQQDFIDDFISYALVVRQVSLKTALGRVLEAGGAENGDTSEILHRIAYEGAVLVLELPAFRLQLLTIASASAHPMVSRGVKGMYASLTAAWFGLYERVLAAAGLELRPGVTAEEFAIVLEAMGEGLGLRLLAELDEPLVDHAAQRSLLGKAALGLMLGFVDNGDGMTLDAAVNSRFPRA
ncbi:hypothetical protein [Sinomonas sp. P10A9]|uniref:TetR family transcriptional regulator n=1 Tax=Sinomonas puerhi TaxID=3238584 RepID=A0AB39L3C7_9MICC